MNHRVGRLVFGFVVGLLAAFFAFRWATDPAPRLERQLEESVVASSRFFLQETLALGELEIVDPLNPVRKVGKTYVGRAGDAWEVSGFYRRSEADLWHPYLVTLDDKQALVLLKVSDPALLDRQGTLPELEILP